MNVSLAMTDLSLATRLVDSLPHGQKGLFNPWRDCSADDLLANTPESRLHRLAQHLDCAPDFILCGEAPGYQGCVRSGIAFTSERLLIEGAIPRVSRVAGRLTERRLPFSEPSATIVWKTLYKLGIAEKTILWNAVQLHPYMPGNRLSNRTPTPAEIALGFPAGPHRRRRAQGRKFAGRDGRPPSRCCSPSGQRRRHGVCRGAVRTGGPHRLKHLFNIGSSSRPTIFGELLP